MHPEAAVNALSELGRIASVYVETCKVVERAPFACLSGLFLYVQSPARYLLRPAIPLMDGVRKSDDHFATSAPAASDLGLVH